MTATLATVDRTVPFHAAASPRASPGPPGQRHRRRHAPGFERPAPFAAPCPSPQGSTRSRGEPSRSRSSISCLSDEQTRCRKRPARSYHRNGIELHHPCGGAKGDGSEVDLPRRMITYLKVRNLAIVEEFVIEPGAGVNVLTGETGAGKSLLIDSLEFLRGARGSTEMIRTGTDKMTAEAIIQLPSGTASALEALGVDVDQQGDGVELIVKREIAAGGRGRVLVNGSPLAVRELASTMDAVLEIHGQHDSHARVAGRVFRELLDDFRDHSAMLYAPPVAHREWRIAAEQLAELTAAQRDRALRLRLLRYQIDQISAAPP